MRPSSDGPIADVRDKSRKANPTLQTIISYQLICPRIIQFLFRAEAQSSAERAEFPLCGLCETLRLRAKPCNREVNKSIYGVKQKWTLSALAPQFPRVWGLLHLSP